MGDLGDKKPSELLASMLELCPRGHEANKFFCFYFCSGYQLPATRVLLGDSKEADPRDLAIHADRLWAMQAHRQVGSVAVMETVEEPSPVAAVQGGQHGRGASNGTTRSTVAAAAPVTPAALARSSSRLCHAHWIYGVVRPHAVGETKCPGAVERRHPWHAGTCGPAHWKAFSCGYGCGLLNFSLPVFSIPQWPIIKWPFRQEHSVQV
jgi:hypothetical protein